MNLYYEAWRVAVDDACWNAAGLSIDDLDDCPLMTWFEDDVPPKCAARRAIRDAGGSE